MRYRSLRAGLAPALLAFLVFAGGCRPSDDELMGPDLRALDSTWTRLPAGGETRCSDGSEYAFFVRRADPLRLLVYFQGGGACWNGETCGLRRTFDPTVDSTDHPARYAGIFDLKNPENPFRDYSMVFVPYCTGDAHLGDLEASYDVAATDSTPARRITLFHWGGPNAEAVLGWVFANFLKPEQVFVAGTSAGAIPSAVYASRLGDHYLKARFAHLADAAGGYRGPQPRLFTAWGASAVMRRAQGLEDLTADSLSFESMMRRSARRHPRAVFAAYDTEADRVQQFFIALSNPPQVPFVELLRANYADVEADVANFRYFLAPGDGHGILPSPAFYEMTSGGVRLRDWVAALAEGSRVDDVDGAATSAPDTAAVTQR